MWWTQGVGSPYDKRVIQGLLGARSSDGDGEGERDPRPILVGLVHRYHSEIILENCWKLSEVEDPVLRAVSIVKDLTARQRAGEKEMYKEAARKNISRSQEDIQANIAYKIVGGRGSKREILEPLLGGQQTNSDGEVIWDREGDTGFSARGRMARRRLGAAAATYPNSLTVGRPEGGTGWGQNLGTALGQTGGHSGPHQSQCMTGGVTRGRGRGAGQISGRGRTAPWQARAGGSRDHQQQHWQQEAGGREWQDVGRRGSTRTRDISLSPP